MLALLASIFDREAKNMRVWKSFFIGLVVLVFFTSFLSGVQAREANLIQGISGTLIKDDEILLGDRGDKIVIYENEVGAFLSEFERNYEQWDEMAAGDVNGDGKDEIIHGDRSSDDIYIFTKTGELLGKKDVNFEAGDDIAVGDLNGDGKEEIVFADRGDILKVYDGTFKELSKFTIDFSNEDSIAVGDVDGDGKAEIIFGDHSKNVVTLYDMYGNHVMSFLTDEYFDLTGRDEIVAGDVNLDGLDEIIIATRDNDNGGLSKGIHVFSIRKEGGNYLQYEISYFGIEYEKGDRIAVGDVNRDGVNEIVWGSQNGRIKVYNYIGELLNAPNGFEAKFEYGSGLAVGDIDGNSIIVGPPVQSRMSITNRVIAIVNAPPVDFDVINAPGLFYATYQMGNTRIVSVSVKAVSDASFTYGITTKTNYLVMNKVEESLKTKTRRELEASGESHTTSEVYNIRADMADAVLYVSTEYDVYEFPIVGPAELAVIDGEQQYVMVTVPKGKPNVHLGNYKSEVHEIGDINTYPVHLEELPGYEAKNELFKYTIEAGEVEGGGGFYMRDFYWEKSENSYSVFASADSKYNFPLGPFGSMDLSTHGYYGESKITTHEVSVSNETQVYIDYKARIEDPEKWYNTTAVVYLDKEYGHLVLDFIVPSKGSYYQERDVSPLGFSYREATLSRLYEPVCEMNIISSSNKVPADVSVSIFASSKGGIKNWTLDFGDGILLKNTGNVSATVSHRYIYPGTYTILFEAENLWGRKVNCTQTVRIVQNDLPKVSFTPSRDRAKEGEEIHFTSAVADEDGTIARVEWDFGDGTVSREPNPTHSYSAPGVYTIKLTVEDNESMRNTYLKTIVIEPLNYPPTAEFSFLPHEPKSGEQVSFADESYDKDGSIVSWEWDFGDGSTSTEVEPSHIYTSEGNYTVTLTVRDDKGAEDAKRLTIMVGGTQASPPMETTTTQETSSTLPTQTQTSSATGGICGLGMLTILSLAPLLLRRKK